VAIISFKAGDAQQIFNITPRDAQDLEKAGYEIFTSDLWSSYYMIPDGVNQDSPFYNIKVRQAAEYAIDRKSIAKAVGLGYYEAISQMATSHTASYVPELKPRDYDPAMAKKLLADAGYPQGFKTKLIATSSFNKDVLVAVQTYLKEVGIEATLDLADQVRLTSISNEGWKNGLFVNSYPTSSDILSLGRAHLAPTAVVSMYRGDMQKYLDAAAKEPDVDKRNAQLKSVVKTIYDNAAAIPLWGQPNINARYKNLHDVHWSVGGHVELWTPADAWLSK
jgi:ABC-type transport system substrate-binding protein